MNSQRVHIRKILVHECLVHDHRHGRFFCRALRYLYAPDRRRKSRFLCFLQVCPLDFPFLRRFGSGKIGRSEVSSQEQPHVHHGEKICANRKIVRFRFLIFRRALKVEARAPQTPAQQRAVRIAHRLDPRNCPETLLQISVKRVNLRRLVSDQRRIQSERQQIARIESGVHTSQVLQCAHQKSRAHQHNDCERHLRDHQSVAQTEPSSPARPSAAELLVPSFRAGVKSTRVPRNAGASPKTIPVATAAANVNSSTRPSMPGPNPNGSSELLVKRVTIARVPQIANKMPSAPPTSERKTLSVSSCCMILLRPAPRDSRSAISFCRAVARESSKPATLAHAIRSTIPTAIIRTYNSPEISVVEPVSPDCAGSASTFGSCSGFESGFAPLSMSLRKTVLTAACACNLSTPGFSRPMTTN